MLISGSSPYILPAGYRCGLNCESTVPLCFQIRFQSLASFWMNSIQSHFQVQQAVPACFLNGSAVWLPSVFWYTKHVFFFLPHVSASIAAVSQKQNAGLKHARGICKVVPVSRKGYTTNGPVYHVM